MHSRGVAGKYSKNVAIVFATVSYSAFLQNLVYGYRGLSVVSLYFAIFAKQRQGESSTLISLSCSVPFFCFYLPPLLSVRRLRRSSVVIYPDLFRRITSWYEQLDFNYSPSQPAIIFCRAIHQALRCSSRWTLACRFAFRGQRQGDL